MYIQKFSCPHCQKQVNVAHMPWTKQCFVGDPEIFEAAITLLRAFVRVEPVRVGEVKEEEG